MIAIIVDNSDMPCSSPSTMKCTICNLASRTFCTLQGLQQHLDKSSSRSDRRKAAAQPIQAEDNEGHLGQVWFLICLWGSCWWQIWELWSLTWMCNCKAFYFWLYIGPIWNLNMSAIRPKNWIEGTDKMSKIWEKLSSTVLEVCFHNACER